MENQFVIIINKDGIERRISKKAYELLKDAKGNLPAGMELAKRPEEVKEKNKVVEKEIEKFLQNKKQQAEVKPAEPEPLKANEPVITAEPKAEAKPKAKRPAAKKKTTKKR